MTQAERLIRNLCETRRLEVLEAQRGALKTFKDTVPWVELPPRVRTLALKHKRLQQGAEEAAKEIRKAGYQFYAHNRIPGELTPLNRDAKRAGLKNTYDRQVEKIQALRTTAVISSLGKSAVDAQLILLQLQHDLKKV